MKRNRRKVLKGVVVSNKMMKTVVVKVKRRVPHPKYGKLVEAWTKCYAHSDGEVKEGQEVKLMECRPLSKLKRWIVVG